MSILNAHRKLEEKYVDLILSAISIIQGLAFTDLITKLPHIYVYTQRTRDVTPLIYFAVCFIILLRVYQTYITAALDYEQWHVRFADLFLVFTVGGLEYFLFDTLSATPLDIKQFHLRFMTISIFGAFGYMYTLWRVTTDLRLNDAEKKIVKKTQTTNILVATFITAISITVLTSTHLSQVPFPVHISNFIGICYCVILTLNIHLSLHMTFNKKVRSVLETEDPLKVRIPLSYSADKPVSSSVKKSFSFIALAVIFLMSIIQLLGNKRQSR